MYLYGKKFVHFVRVLYVYMGNINYFVLYMFVYALCVCVYMHFKGFAVILLYVLFLGILFCPASSCFTR